MRSWVFPGHSLTYYAEHQVGASYGAFPPKIAASIGCSLEQAEEIFNAYHNDLYPKITEYRENYVLPTAKENGKLHLALGFYIHTDDPAKDIRTIANASIQAWSLLSILAINELHRRIDSEGLQDKVRVISSIYDSVYIECEATPDIIKWVNDNLIECMIQDFMLDQTVPNEATAEIGLNWADLHQIPNNATLEQITTILESL